MADHLTSQEADDRVAAALAGLKEIEDELRPVHANTADAFKRARRELLLVQAPSGRQESEA
jgi:hypothetical protein